MMQQHPQQSRPVRWVSFRDVRIEVQDNIVIVSVVERRHRPIDVTGRKEIRQGGHAEKALRDAGASEGGFLIGRHFDKAGQEIKKSTCPAVAMTSRSRPR